MRLHCQQIRQAEMVAEDGEMSGWEVDCVIFC
jgi:hypothetical protein